METKRHVFVIRLNINWILVNLKISPGAVCLPFDDPKIAYAPCLHIQLPGSFMRRSDTHTAQTSVGGVCGDRDRSCMCTYKAPFEES